jgi:formylglycine-generating enzyme required for sulfatase activity
MKATRRHHRQARDLGDDRAKPAMAQALSRRGPAHEVSVGGFWMDRHTVTNRDFQLFAGAPSTTPVIKVRP